jgi:hypothetical protein
MYCKDKTKENGTTSLVSFSINSFVFLLQMILTFLLKVRLYQGIILSLYPFTLIGLIERFKLL